MLFNNYLEGEKIILDLLNIITELTLIAGRYKTELIFKEREEI